MGMSIEESIAAAKRQARSSAAAGGRQLTRDQLMVLDEIGENARAVGGDVEYAGLELAGRGQQGAELAGTRGSYTESQQRGTPWWQTALQGAAGVGAAFAGRGGGGA